MGKDEKSIYTYFQEYNRDLVDCVYNAATSKEARTIFIKKWGPHLRGVIYSTMTEKENELFVNYVSTFEKYLVYAQNLQAKGYSLSNIKNILAQKSATADAVVHKKKSVILYNNINSVLRKYNITKEELQSVLETVPPQIKQCFVCLYGVNRPQMSLEKVEEVLHISHVFTLKSIQDVYDALEQYQVNRDIKSDLFKENEQTPSRYASIYMYFNQNEREYVTKAIQWYSENKLEYYNIILKAYGKHYDKWSSKIKLTKEENNLLSYIIGSDLPYLVNQIKYSNINDQKRFKKKESFYDYFDETEKDNVTERIEWWKIHNINYYNFIVKLYGPTYDHLNTTIELTKEESKLMNNIITVLKLSLEKRSKGNTSKISRKKESFYDYFDETEKDNITRKIEWWKIHNANYYNFIVKLYGPTYDHLNTTIELTKEESKLMNNITTVLKASLERKKKYTTKIWEESFYAYFDETEKDNVTERIEWWKGNNPARYQLIVKLYGPNYNCLNTTIQLTKEEKQMWSNIIKQLKTYISKRKDGYVIHGPKRKESIYDYFDETEKDYVTEKIEWWKENNPERYQLIVKLYGPTYNCLNTTIQLTKEEQKLCANIISQLRIYISKRKNGPVAERLERKESIYDYFEETEKDYVTERIEWWKIHNENYYNFIVKLYGPTYNCLNKTIKLTNDNQQMCVNIISQLRIYISKRKNGPVATRVERKESIYDYFDETEKDYATERIEWWKENNPERYQLIVKLYGPTYNCLNKTIKLTNKEQKLWSNILIQLRQYISRRKNGYVVWGSKRKGSIYAYFKESEKDYVTERIKWWKENNPERYQLIVKLYGNTYDCLNNTIKFTQEETNKWESLLQNLRDYVSKKKKQNIQNEITNSKSNIQEPSIKNDKEIHLSLELMKENILFEASPQELVLFTYFKQHHQVKEQKLCDVLGISIDTLDNFYIKYLHLFQGQIPQIIERMITRNPNNVNRILNESYLKEYLPYLTSQEKMYLQLKLQSYANSNITDSMIAEFMNLNVLDLQQYEIMTPYDELNQFNQFIKK